MNETRLNSLLERKKSAQAHFPQNETEFAETFFRRIDERRKTRRTALLRFAACFLVLSVAAVSVLLLPLTRKAFVTYNPYTGLAETVRLFGEDAAVLFVNDELYTGARSESPPDNLVILTLLDGNGKIIRLSLACSDQDTIYLDTPGISGEFVSSRCDGETLVLDLDLNWNVRRIRTDLPAIRRSGNHYDGREQG